MRKTRNSRVHATSAKEVPPHRVGGNDTELSHDVAEAALLRLLHRMLPEKRRCANPSELAVIEQVIAYIQDLETALDQGQARSCTTTFDECPKQPSGGHLTLHSDAGPDQGSPGKMTYANAATDHSATPMVGAVCLLVPVDIRPLRNLSQLIIYYPARGIYGEMEQLGYIFETYLRLREVSPDRTIGPPKRRLS